jgi:ubiquinone/menaquinone biosynthesis C-methylase UbiE
MGEQTFPDSTRRGNCNQPSAVAMWTIPRHDEPGAGRLRWRAAAAAAAAVWLLVAGLAPALGARGAREAERIAEVLQIAPGAAVADVGAGAGDFTVALARRVGPEGAIYATEISPAQLRAIRRAVAHAGLAQVTVVEATADDTGLPDACCDAILMRRVYHHLTAPEPTTASLWRALRPGGLLAVIDFEPSQGSEAPAGVPADRGGHGVPQRLVASELEAAGFEVLRTEERWSGRDYLVLARRPG